MPKGLNLRSDLGKLSDAELAERLEAAWRTVDKSVPLDSWHGRFEFWPIATVRGPARHPRIYRFLRILGGMEMGMFGLPFAWVLSSKRFSGDMMDADLAACEIRDINDEIERRLRRRKKAGE